MRINIKDVETNVAELTKRATFDMDFIYDLLVAYGKPKTSIARLKKGDYNLATDKINEIYWKSNLLFRQITDEDLHGVIDDLKNSSYASRHNPRFIVVTNYLELLAIDTKTGETLDIPIAELHRHYVFFLPWAGMEKSSAKTENIADIKAAERMAKLYDEIIKHNTVKDTAFYHALNVFFSRLLFCFFAEDTEVFTSSQFTNSIASHTQTDGSDLHEYLDVLFKALDVEYKGSDYPAHIAAFPYVNGGLFGKYYASPKFSPQARRLILECGELDWSQINPDIFGSMIQAVVRNKADDDTMHYTSVPNIMKVIEPLFLETLLEEFENADRDQRKLAKLLQRIYAIKIFDPACGSGNFLIIAYKELRKLEHKILEILLENKLSGLKVASGLKLENFYGIEIDDFAHEVAILSLWLAKHQMNIEFKKKFGKDIPLIPLKDTGNVTCGNAATIDWRELVPSSIDDELYIIGNPPYAGSSMQTPEQKKELADICKDFSNYKNLDYISIWIIKSARYIENSAAKAALVSTNSICQGDQVALLWPHVLSSNIEIEFAHTSFKWSNSAKHNAGVICVILGLSSHSKRQKRLFIGNIGQNVSNINAYLLDSPDIYIPRRSSPLSNLPEIVYGNKPTDDGNLILNQVEKDKLIEESPASERFILKYMGSEDLIKGKRRYCLWIKDNDLKSAMEIPEIAKRLAAVSIFRKKSKAGSTSEYANYPNRFKQRTYREQDSIVIPEVSSERREYIPMDFIDKNTVISNKAYAIYGAEIYVFGLMLSKMHMTWVKAVAGRLKSDLSYSSTIVYNNFPTPSVSEKQQQMITNNVYEVLDIREKYSERNLAELYDPNKMPDDLRKAHQDLDEVVEACYRVRPFDGDEDRLAHLFKLYETMIAAEEKQNA